LHVEQVVSEDHAVSFEVGATPMTAWKTGEVRFNGGHADDGVGDTARSMSRT
jgi:hypothetical protein